MKKLFTFFALALFSAIGLGGGSVAQAAVETYDFAAFVAGGAPTLTLTTTEVKQEGTNAKTLYVVGDQTNTSGTTLHLDSSNCSFCQGTYCAEESQGKKSK